MAQLIALSHVARERKRVLKNLSEGRDVTLKAARLKEQFTAAGRYLRLP
jgi:hypothetical protein